MFDNETFQIIGEKVLVIILAIIVAKIAMSVCKKCLKKVLDKTKLDPMMYEFIGHVIDVFIWLAALIAILQVLGINAASILTVIAACGAAVALALKDSLSNLAGGILIMLSGNFKKGDYITCAGSSGTVEHIDLLHNTIITVDNKEISIPNGQLTTNSITNYSSMENRRVDVSIGVDYSTDIEHARDVMLGLAAEDGRILKDPAAVVIVEKYDSSAIILTLRAWTKSANYWDVMFDYQNRLKPEFDKSGISIPYPHMDVALRNKA